MTSYLRLMLCLVLILGCRTGPPSVFRQKYDLTCVYNPKYTAAQRRLVFPFNRADTVKLISFHHHMEWAPVDSDRIIGDSVLESRTLTGHGIDSLSDILLNYAFVHPSNIGHIPGCFNPRNAVLFLNKEGRLVSIDVICFECGFDESEPQEKFYTMDCPEKLNRLRVFFAAQGVTFGTSDAQNFDGLGPLNDAHPDTKIVIPHPKNP